MTLRTNTGQTAHIILASASQARLQILTNAGVSCLCRPSAVDENLIKQKAAAESWNADTTAERLAIAKAINISKQNNTALVIGADQMLTCGGVSFDKPESVHEAKNHLLKLSGNTHILHSGVCVVKNEKTVWSYVGQSYLTMRRLDETEIDDYLQIAGDQVISSVGAYQLEGLGAQLFEKIEGDYFSILGLPLLPLLAILRQQKAI